MWSNPQIGVGIAQKESTGSRFVLRNSKTQILTLGIKFMESLTLFPILDRISYCASIPSVARYRC